MRTMCSICTKVFSTLFCHNRHVKEVHGVEVRICYGKDSNFNSRCLEPNCDSAFTTNKRLIEHLQNIHSIKFETELCSLDNMNDFINWKSEMELANNSNYIMKGSYANTTGHVIYFKCNRSKNGYNIKATEERQRRLKRQGSCKLNSSCTSEIKVNVTNGKILLEWQKVHYGHDIDLQHIRLPKIEKEKIVTKLIKGVTTQRILETTRDRIGDDLKRVDLLTSKDIRNIKRNLIYKKGLKLRDDTDSPVEDSDISEEPQLLNEKILGIKAMAAKLDSLNFKALDDETIIKIHDHLTMLPDFPNISAVNNEFEIKNQTSKRPIESQTRFTSTKKKRIETRTSLKRASVQEAKNIQENLTHTTGDSFIYDHQYC